jgi:ribosomal protein S18 acetylase RimI-like enzyme
MNLTYEKMQSADQAVIKFSLETRQLLFPELYQSNIPKDIENFEQYYIDHPLGCFIVVKDQAKIIGTIAYRAYDGRFDVDVAQGAVEIVKLFVLPEYRRQGIATQLCQLLFEHAKQQGIETLYLHTHPFLPAAEQFWMLQGFDVIKREWLTTYDIIHMRKQLLVVA